MPALPYPCRVYMLGHVVCVSVRKKPRYERGGHGREYEAP